MEQYLIITLIMTLVFVVLINATFSYFANKSNPVFNYDKKLKKVIAGNNNKIKGSNNGVLLGYYGKKPIYCSDNAKHIFVCGTTGSGKTVALSNFINRANEEDFPILIVDGKGDIGDNSLLDMVNKLSSRKTYVINLNDPINSDKYNPFRNANPTVCKDMLINLTDWSEEHYKLNTERYLQAVIKHMVMNDIELSYHTILKYINPNNFKELSLDLKKKEILTKEEHINNLSMIDSLKFIIDGATARFSLLAESEIGSIFSEDGIDIHTAIEEKATILFILNPLLYPETSSLMGKLIIIDSKKAVSYKYGDKQRCYYMFDEVGSYSSNALINLVNKSRSANITCILATQSLSDLDKSVDINFREQVIENCNNYILMRQNSAKNAEDWANIIGTRNSVDTTYQLSNETGITTPTGQGTMKFTKEYIFHPDDIKDLGVGEAFYVSKDDKIKVKIKVNKPL